MKKKLIWLVLLPLSLMTVFSCKELINIEETDFIGGATALRTVGNNESLLMGAYQSLGASADFSTEMAIRLNGVLSDELKPGSFYSHNSTHEWTFASDDVTIRDIYMANTVHYRVIDRANRILQALPDAIGSGPADEALRSKVKGEALFLRAFSHFELFRYYCENYNPAGLGMPYMEEPSLVGHERINMGDYFEKILRDLNESKPLLQNNLSDVFRANRLAAVGLHARIALYMRNWPDAITYSTEYIQGIPLSSKAGFDGIWTDENSNELAWKLKRNTSNRIGSFYMGVFSKNAAGVISPPTENSWVPSSKLWNTFDQVNDVRFDSYLLDEPLLAAIPNKPHQIVHKYAGTGYATSNENVADIKIFRTAEMYLIRAEARAESSAFTGANSAESDLNDLRAARITGYTNVTLASKEAAIQAVLDERFKELAFEGHRFWDLKRRGLAVERLAADAPKPTAITLPAGNFRFVMPIPQSEMLANPKMVQNEGYK